MKTEINEYKGGFLIHLVPETLDDANKLSRMGLNHKKKNINLYVRCTKTDGINADIYFDKMQKDRYLIR